MAGRFGRVKWFSQRLPGGRLTVPRRAGIPAGREPFQPMRQIGFGHRRPPIDTYPPRG